MSARRMRWTGVPGSWLEHGFATLILASSDVVATSDIPLHALSREAVRGPRADRRVGDARRHLAVPAARRPRPRDPREPRRAPDRAHRRDDRDLDRDRR